MKSGLRTFFGIAAITSAIALSAVRADACTGITLKTVDGKLVPARTIEWGGSNLNSRYVVVPRGYAQQSMTPGGKTEGMRFSARYGYVGLSVEMKEFVAEGINEAGLSAGLFYFPGYGKYEDYDECLKESSIADLQLVSWILGNFKTVEEVKEGMKNVHVIAIDPRASTIHWRITDKSGKQMIIEIIDGKTNFHEDGIGVLTNSPDFRWQMTNLNNYVNLYPGGAKPQKIGEMNLNAFGAGSGFLGIPGDVTPPSRFVRAAFFQNTAPAQKDEESAALQAFQILNNFDIPMGVEFGAGEIPADIPSATQWTSATDMYNLKIYYRTMYNSSIRCIDLKTIDFSKVKYTDMPLDEVMRQPVTYIKIK